MDHLHHLPSGVISEMNGRSARHHLFSRKKKKITLLSHSEDIPSALPDQ